MLRGLRKRKEENGLRKKPPLPVEQLPGNGAGPDLRVQVLGVGRPRNAMLIYPHLRTFHGSQVRIGDQGLLAHAVEVLACPVNWLAFVVAERGF
jgi:hypothetical protein